MKFFYGCILLLGGLAAWFASVAVYQALLCELQIMTFQLLVARIAGSLLLGICAFGLISTSAWMAIGSLLRRRGVQLCWSSRSIPELTGIDKRDRARAFNSCQFRILGEWQTWAMLIAIILIAGIGCKLIFPLREPHAFILTGLLGGAAGGALGQYFTSRTRRRLREYPVRSQTDSDRGPLESDRPST